MATALRCIYPVLQQTPWLLHCAASIQSCNRLHGYCTALHLSSPAGTTRLTAVMAELGVDSAVMLAVELDVRVTRIRLVLTISTHANYSSVVISIRTV